MFYRYCWHVLLPYSFHCITLIWAFKIQLAFDRHHHGTTPKTNNAAQNTRHQEEALLSHRHDFERVPQLGDEMPKHLYRVLHKVIRKKE
jgi:hypothetical protein